MERWKTWFVFGKKIALQNIKLIVFSFVGGVLITSAVAITKAYSETVQQGVAESVLRFHVLANSDSQEDQQLKLAVRDAVLLEMEPQLKQMKSKEQAESMMEEALPRIQSIAETTLLEQGSNQAVAVCFSKELFPFRKYGDAVFPAGYYDAVRISLGRGEGKNWWCVMFPPLCFVDATYAQTDEETKEKLKQVLTAEEYEIVIDSQTSQKITPKIKWKIVELWQKKETKNEKFITKP